MIGTSRASATARADGGLLLQAADGVLWAVEPDELVEHQADTKEFVPADADVSEGVVDGGKFAVFQHVGPYNTVPQTWQRIMEEWMPTGAMAVRMAMPFEMYVNDPADTPVEELVTEICIPVE
jgi:effector-binding domain-containing protein